VPLTCPFPFVSGLPDA